MKAECGARRNSVRIGRGGRDPANIVGSDDYSILHVDVTCSRCGIPRHRPQVRRVTRSNAIARHNRMTMGSITEIVGTVHGNPRSGSDNQNCRQQSLANRVYTVSEANRVALGRGQRRLIDGKNLKMRASRRLLPCARPWWYAQEAHSRWRSSMCGGEGGIRTLDGLSTHTPLAGERLQPLGHLSGRVPEYTKEVIARKTAPWRLLSARFLRATVQRTRYERPRRQQEAAGALPVCPPDCSDFPS